MASLSVGDPGSRGLPSDLSAAASQEPPAEPTTTLPATQEAAWHNRRNFGEQLTGKRSFKAVVNVMTDFPEAEEGKGFMMVANLTTGMTVSTPGRLPPHHRDPPHIPDFQFAPGVCSFCERCRTLMSKEGLLQASTESGYCHAKIDNWKRFLTERAEEKCALCKYIIAQWPVRRGWSKKEPTEILIYADFVDNALNGIQIFFKYDPDQGSEHEEMPHLLRPTEYYIRTIPGSGRIIFLTCSKVTNVCVLTEAQMASLIGCVSGSCLSQTLRATRHSMPYVPCSGTVLRATRLVFQRKRRFFPLTL